MTKDNEPPRRFDVRTLERNLKRGLVSRKDVEKHLKSLPDSSERVAHMPEASGGRSDTAGTDPQE